MSLLRTDAFSCWAALLFAASATTTTEWGASMATMSGMEMPGGWTMSMTWMRMPAQSWSGAAATFVGMWLVMMIAMMLPSLTPVLLRYRDSLDKSGERYANRMSAMVGAGYFAVWTVFGAAAYLLGTVLALLDMRHPALSRSVPITAGIAVVTAGALQFSRWKSRHLACCRAVAMPDRVASTTGGGAWRQGIRLGLHCTYCCVGPTAVLLVVGVMDLRAMACITAAITAERLVPYGERAARVIGILIIGCGLYMLARASTNT